MFQQNTSALTLDICNDTSFRELTEDEIDLVNGAWVMNALGALVGGVATAAGVSVAGGSYSEIAGGFAAGAVAGAVNPISSVGSVARLAAGGLAAGAVGETVGESF